MLALSVLAQSTTTFPTSTYVWIVIAAVFVVMFGGLVVLHLRKKMLDQASAHNTSASLMETLRDMHKRGEISNEEYEQTRKSMASRISQMLDTKRSDGLFELPDPKRRIGSNTPRGPIAPPANPARPTGARSRATDMPPGYDANDKRGGSEDQPASSGDRP